MVLDIYRNTDVFKFYIQQILVPQLWAGAIVLMDNLKVHHAFVVIEAIEAAGAKLVFVPPYSPDLSPIELCWSLPFIVSDYADMI